MRRFRSIKVRLEPFFKDQKTTKGVFSYVDLTVVCGEPEFHDKFRDVLINPTVIVEILSDSIEDFNRDEKFRRYRRHKDSLQDYVLIEQTMPLIEVYSRRPDGWLMTEALGLESSISLPSIDCRLSLSEVYDCVVFPPEEDEVETEPEAEER